MFEGVYRNMEPIADFGAKRTLGVGGSVRGYIETGNAYDKHYYNKDTKPDAFEKTDKKAKAGKIAGAIAALAAAGAAVFVAIKHPEKAKELLGNATDAAKKLPDILKGAFKKAGKVASDAVAKVREKLPKTSVKELFGKLKDETIKEKNQLADNVKKLKITDKFKALFAKFGKKAVESAEDMRMYI